MRLVLKGKTGWGCNKNFNKNKKKTIQKKRKQNKTLIAALLHHFVEELGSLISHLQPVMSGVTLHLIHIIHNLSLSTITAGIFFSYLTDNLLFRWLGQATQKSTTISPSQRNSTTYLHITHPQKISNCSHVTKLKNASYRTDEGFVLWRFSAQLRCPSAGSKRARGKWQAAQDSTERRRVGWGLYDAITAGQNIEQSYSPTAEGDLIRKPCISNDEKSHRRRRLATLPAIGWW